MHRIYENDDIAVFWDSEKCFHAKRCVTASPATFDRDRRPWIDLSKAPTMEIWKAVENCPSGALACVYRHDVTVGLDEGKCRTIASHEGKVIGECDYRITPEGWEIYHTEVDDGFTGKGIAKRLVYRITEAAEKAGSKVIPTCSYAARLFREPDA